MKLVFFDKYSYLKQAKRRKAEIVAELEAKLKPFEIQIKDLMFDRDKQYRRILKKICLKTPRKVIADPYVKMEDILVKLG